MFRHFDCQNGFSYLKKSVACRSGSITFASGLGNRRRPCPNGKRFRCNNRRGVNSTENSDLFAVFVRDVSFPERPDDQVRVGDSRLREDFEDVRLAVADTDASRIFVTFGQSDRLAATFEPSKASLLFDRHCRKIFLFEFFLFRRFIFSDDDFVSECSQRRAVGHERFEQMKICSSPDGACSDRPGSANLLFRPCQVKFGGILYAKDDVLRGDALLCRLRMGLENFFEGRFLILEKSIGGHGFGVSATGRRNTDLGVLTQCSQDFGESFIESLVIQISRSKLLTDPIAIHFTISLPGFRALQDIAEQEG